MGEVFLFGVNAVLPIVLLMAIGYALKSFGVLEKSFFEKGNTFVFNVALPVMMFVNVYDIDKASDINWSTVLFSLAIAFILFGLGFITAQFVKDNRQKGVVWQSFFWANTAIIGIPLATALGGKQAAALVSVMAAFCVTLYNILSVICLSVFINTDKKTTFREFVWNTVKNPLIIAIVSGLLMVFVRSLLPQVNGEPCFTIKANLPFVYSALTMIKNMASPFSLIVLGGIFSFSAVKELKKQIALCTVTRLVFAPLIGILLAVLCKAWLNFGTPEFAAFVAIFSPPVAVSSLAMSDQMGNDAQLAGQVIVWTTVLSIFTVFAATVVLRFAGLI